MNQFVILHFFILFFQYRNSLMHRLQQDILSMGTRRMRSIFKRNNSNNKSTHQRNHRLQATKPCP